MQQVKYIQHMLSFLDVVIEKPVTIRCDNQAAIKMIQNEQISQRTKHIDLKYQLVRDEVKKNNFKVEYVESERNLADIFTKVLPTKAFRNLRDKLIK